MSFWKGIFLIFCLLPIAFCRFGVRNKNLPYRQHTEQLIEHINGAQSSWKAGFNFHPDVNESYIRGLCGSLSDKIRLHERNHRLTGLTIPNEFDSRVKWPSCTSIQEIRDQGSCGSCWAVSAVETMTDRYCIAHKGQNDFRFSAENMVSCCWECGFGCRGGFPRAAWEYYVWIGVVSGGPFNSSSGCQPYEIAPCEHHILGPRPNCTEIGSTPKCVKTCENSYDVNYKEDKHYGRKAYSISRKPAQIQVEIMTNGPVQATLSVYSDFPLYKSGVYHHVSGSYLGGHAVKIVGWGVENEIPYWLVANSWNADWGDKGFFRIKRGENECGIEGGIVAGLPKI